jgi:hypothetical protein
VARYAPSSVDLGDEYVAREPFPPFGLKALDDLNDGFRLVSNP